MTDRITQEQASDKAWEILSALKNGNSKEEKVDVSFTLYLTEIISTRGTTDDPVLSRELVNDVIAAMMKHGVGMHDWPLILDHLVKAIQMVVLYNIPDIYQERAAQLTAAEVEKGFDRTRQEYYKIMGLE